MKNTAKKSEQRERLFRALGGISDSLVLETIPEKQKNRGRKKRQLLQKIMPLAACMALLSLAGLAAYRMELLPPLSTKEETPQASLTPDENLPVITASAAFDDMGYEGLLAHDASELITGNPWTKDLELAALPVYENAYAYEEDYRTTGASEKDMYDFLYALSERLGLDREQLSVTREEEPIFEVGTLEKTGSYLRAAAVKTEDFSIRVSNDMTARIEVQAPEPLPVPFTCHNTREELLAIGETLKKTWQDFLSMEQPVISIDGGYYDYSGAAQSYDLSFYDQTGGAEEQILNYAFGKVSFSGIPEEGSLSIDTAHFDLSRKIGSYPVISWQEAEALLKSGTYISSVPEEYLENPSVAAVELVYRTGPANAYLLPYYRFLVELPAEALSEEAKNAGLKEYGACYVPAIEPRYVEYPEPEEVFFQ